MLRVRPGNPGNYQRLRREDFFETNERRLIFEDGVKVDVLSNDTVILANNALCAVQVDRLNRPNAGANVAICLPERVHGREVLFYSPTIGPLTVR